MKYVIIEKHSNNISSPERASYHKFIYCYKGNLSFTFNGKRFEMTDNCFAILLNNRNPTKVATTDTLDCAVCYIEENFMRQSGPTNPYTIQAILSLNSNPIMQLNEKEQDLCLALFRNFRKRIEETDHRFYDDILRTSARMLMLDTLDFHARKHENENTSVSSANLMTKFINMLEAKEYRENREVAYYAEKLHVVPKYLSEISNKISGYSASYWINRYTSQDLNLLLLEKELSIQEIVKLFNFTSTSYFNRYVKRNLGSYPSELRGK